MFADVHRSTSGANDLDGLVQELHRQESSKAKMEIGDVIRVRGYIKVFRMQREVVASIFCKENFILQMRCLFILVWVVLGISWHFWHKFGICLPTHVHFIALVGFCYTSL